MNFFRLYTKAAISIPLRHDRLCLFAFLIPLVFIRRILVKLISILIVEGIHSFHEIIRNKIALKIFIDADDKTLRTLRYKANIIKRGFSEDDAMKRLDLEMDEYYQFLHPNKKYADKIINVDENFNYQFAEPS